jgi:cobalamin biosynthesis Co2+ chelatase CbiK
VPKLVTGFKPKSLRKVREEVKKRKKKRPIKRAFTSSLIITISTSPSRRCSKMKG